MNYTNKRLKLKLITLSLLQILIGLSPNLAKSNEIVQNDLQHCQKVLNYCMKERDKAEQFGLLCKKTLNLGQKRNELMSKELTKCNEIVKEQKLEVANQIKQVEAVKEDKTSSVVIFSVLSFLLATFLHIPVHF